MPLINVIKPFGLRLGSGRDVQHFGVGEHFVSDEEFDHWFVQDCLKDGRAMLVVNPVPEEEAMQEDSGEGQPPAGEEPEAGVDGNRADEDSDEPGDEPAAPTREVLMALTVAQLKEIAAKCGVALASNATKAAIVDALLASQESK